MVTAIDFGMDSIPKKIKNIFSTLSIDKVEKKEVSSRITSHDSGVVVWDVTVRASGLLFKDVLDANKNLIQVDKVNKDYGASIDGSFIIKFKGKTYPC